jgi:hypothetical protein
MTQWNSLFCLPEPSKNSVDCLQQTLIQLEYTLYDAFDLIPGNSYPDTFKTFIAPTNGQWAHILLDDEDVEDLELLAEPLSDYGLCLLVHLDQAEATLTLYEHRVQVDIAQGLVNHLLGGKSVDDLNRALSGKLPLPTIETQADEQSQILAINDLPHDMRQMAQGINLPNAQKMFQRFTGSLMGRGDAQDAQDLLNADPLDWNSAGGMTIRGVMACLIAGDSWLSPDFATVRDAYQRHIRLHRRPTAKLYPGDQQMMDAVPNALDYKPVYGGQD